MKRISMFIAAIGLLCGAGANGAVIGFDNLGGVNGSPFASPYVEDGFTVAPTGGSWFVANAFGHPTPAIFAGPIGSPGVSTIQITGGNFTFAGVDLTSNSTPGTSYLIQGFLGITSVFSQVAVINNVNTFNTILSISTALIDRLTITGRPAPDVTSFNIDNIQVTAAAQVSSPETLSLFAIALLIIGGVAARRKLI